MAKLKSTKISFLYNTTQQRYIVWQHTEWLRKHYGVQGVQKDKHWYTKVTYGKGMMPGLWTETYNIYFRDSKHALHFQLSCL
jgi:hypothetical protein